MNNAENRTGTKVRDDTGVEFLIGKQLGNAGAQGVVYRVEQQPDYAIKLLKNEEDLVQIENVRRLPLGDLRIAAPISLIRTGGVGYLMNLASDMSPFTNPYLPFEFGKEAKKNTDGWYQTTGGIHRRLRLLAGIAQTLADVHERGLAYVDLNPNNVMVSTDMSRYETMLIDSDNLTSRANPTGRILGFPGYMVPERALRGAPPSTLADCYTLAIMVFRTLTLIHPLEGKSLMKLDGTEAREALRKGTPEYVGSDSDTSNEIKKNTLQRFLFENALSAVLRELLHETFVPGKSNPLARPSAARWRDALWGAADNVVHCSNNCGWNYFRSSSICPVCEAPNPDFGIVSIVQTWNEEVWPGVTNKILRSFVLPYTSATIIQSRHLWGSYESADPLITFSPIKKGFIVSSAPHVNVTDASGNDVKMLPFPETNQVFRLSIVCPGRPQRLLNVGSVKKK